jgi:large subunit ribosomal protein L2
MAIKKFKPTSPSLRKMVVLSSKGLTQTVKPLKNLMEKKTKTAGRNSHGRITSRRRGGGAKQKYRIIDFKRTRLIFLQLLRQFTMIQTEHVILLY